MKPLSLLCFTVVFGCNRPAPIAPPATVEIVPPPCATPAPLLGEFDPRTSGYIVVLDDGIEPGPETSRLAAKYSFEPEHVYTHVLGGFSAQLTPTVVADLRCEITVDHVSFNSVGSVDI